jgi:hypothetical protein
MEWDRLDDFPYPSNLHKGWKQACADANVCAAGNATPQSHRDVRLELLELRARLFVLYGGQDSGREDNACKRKSRARWLADWQAHDRKLMTEGLIAEEEWSSDAE